MHVKYFYCYFHHIDPATFLHHFWKNTLKNFRVPRENYFGYFENTPKNFRAPRENLFEICLKIPLGIMFSKGFWGR